MVVGVESEEGGRLCGVKGGESLERRVERRIEPLCGCELVVRLFVGLLVVLCTLLRVDRPLQSSFGF